MLDSIKTTIVNKQVNFWLFFLLLSILALAMVFIYGSSSSHPGYDYYFHLKRFEALITSLKEGTFPFYIDRAAALNYGYLSRVFYSDIILIPFALLGTITNAYFAYDIMLFVMTILCGLLMHKTINTIYKSSFAGVIGALLYTFSVYRLYDIYHRGALGEVFAFTFVPIIFLGLYHIIKGDYKKWYIIAVGFSLLILSHVISTVLVAITVAIILVIYLKIFIKEPVRLMYLAIAGIVCVCITIGYTLPLFEQIVSNKFYYQEYDWVTPANAKLPFVHLLWGLICGFVYPKNISIVGIGIILSLSIFLRLFVRDKSQMTRSVDMGVLIGLFYIFATSFLFPWGRFPFTLLSFIQYPSRLYLLVSFFFSVAAGYYLSCLFTKFRSQLIITFIAIGAIIAIFYFHSENYKYMHAHYINESNNEPSIRNFFYLNGAEYLPVKVPSANYIKERGDSVIAKNTDTKIENFTRKEAATIFDVRVNKTDSLELPLIYYKGYKSELNGKNIVVTESKRGFLQIPINESGRVEAVYEGTVIQKVSFYISIVSVLFLFVFIYLQKKKRVRTKKIK